MKTKSIKIKIKFIISTIMIAAMIIPTFGVSNDAFVTREEFDKEISEFNSRMNKFEAGINSKIDMQVSSYLTRNSIWSAVDQEKFWPSVRDTSTDAAIRKILVFPIEDYPVAGRVSQYFQFPKGVGNAWSDNAYASWPWDSAAHTWAMQQGKRCELFWRCDKLCKINKEGLLVMNVLYDGSLYNNYMGVGGSGLAADSVSQIETSINFGVGQADRTYTTYLNTQLSYVRKSVADIRYTWSLPRGFGYWQDLTQKSVIPVKFFVKPGDEIYFDVITLAVSNMTNASLDNLTAWNEPTAVYGTLNRYSLSPYLLLLSAVVY